MCLLYCIYCSGKNVSIVLFGGHSTVVSCTKMPSENQRKSIQKGQLAFNSSYYVGIAKERVFSRLHTNPRPLLISCENRPRRLLLLCQTHVISHKICGQRSSVSITQRPRFFVTQRLFYGLAVFLRRDSEFVTASVLWTVSDDEIAKH